MGGECQKKETFEIMFLHPVNNMQIYLEYKGIDKLVAIELYIPIFKVFGFDFKEMSELFIWSKEGLIYFNFYIPHLIEKEI